MKYSLIFLLFMFGCAKDGINESQTENPNFNVTFLFEYEGIKVYRFYDEGRYHWFTSKGECLNTKREFVHTGKTTIIKRRDDVL